jgi:hypothetical protein
VTTARRDGLSSDHMAARQHGHTAARPQGRPVAAARRDGRTGRWPRGRCPAAFGGDLSPNSHVETAARRRDCRSSKHPRGEPATARRDSDRESECLVSRAVAAAHGTRRTARPHGRTAMRRDGGAADSWPQAVHRPCTVWRGAQPRGSQPRGAGRWLRGDTATRGVGRAAAARRKSSGRGSIRGRSLAEFRDSGDCGVPGLQPRCSMQNV